nr:hypothetical protein [Aminipila sp.]
MMIVFALIFGQGLREFQRVEFTQRENLIVGMLMSIILEQLVLREKLIK